MKTLIAAGILAISANCAFADTLPDPMNVNEMICSRYLQDLAQLEYLTIKENYIARQITDREKLIKSVKYSPGVEGLFHTAQNYCQMPIPNEFLEDNIRQMIAGIFGPEKD